MSNIQYSRMNLDIGKDVTFTAFPNDELSTSEMTVSTDQLLTDLEAGQIRRWTTYTVRARDKK